MSDRRYSLRKDFWVNADDEKMFPCDFGNNHLRNTIKCIRDRHKIFKHDTFLDYCDEFKISKQNEKDNIYRKIFCDEYWYAKQPLYKALIDEYKKRALAEIITVDPKDESYASSKDALEVMGYDVQVINLEDITCADTYNPIEEIEKLPVEKQKEILGEIEKLTNEKRE